MFRVLAISIALLLATAQAVVAQATPPAGSGRVIQVYVAKPPSDDARRGLTSWLQAFRGSLRFLLADALGQPGSMPALRVSVVVEDVDFADEAMLEASFGRQPTLQALSTIASASGQTTFVNSDIYLGDLAGSLEGPFIYLRREIQPGEYKPNREAVSAITLYAYAMAMARTGGGAETRISVCQLLDRANMYRRPEGLDPGIRASLGDLFRAIDRELQGRECGGKR